ncbi:hypothetical protein L9F63_012940 [Diploptera punctata]|uniref:DUF4746 domain-containing protein n=1 Tax=Diploptera punctata TaxID=6984 RepID=A0AAD8AB78_DIPPU|nr:hypothetical protein L9F63_012940 [Diploptera punctata]
MRNLMKHIGNYTVIMIMPYLYEDGVCEAWLELSEIITEMGYSVEDEEKIQLDADLAAELIYSGMGEVSEEFIEKLEAPAVVKLMLYRKPDASETEFETEPPAEGEEEGSESDEEEVGEAKTEETDALVEIVKLIYGHTADVRQEGEMEADPESFEGRFRPSPDLPGMWTPYTPNAKANAIMKLFPRFAAKFALPPPPELPPVMTMIFNATKSAEVSEMVAENEENVICLAYFSGPDPSTAKKIALTKEQYDQRKKKSDDDKIVLIVNRKKSEPLLSFCQLSPIYISANIEDGKKDYEAFFAEEEEEQFIEPDELEEEVPEILTLPDEISTVEADSVSYTYERAEKFEEKYDEISEISALGRIEETGGVPGPQEPQSSGEPAAAVGEQATTEESEQMPTPEESIPSAEPPPPSEEPPTPSEQPE